MNKKITVSVVVARDIAHVFECWTKPEHITKWAFASDDWEAPYAEHDVREGGRFLTRMQAKDGSAGFDFTGKYTRVERPTILDSQLDDGRTVSVRFEAKGEHKTAVIETFEMELENSEEMQREGWQAFLENFKKHAESHSSS